MWPATATTAALCFLAALAVAAALRIMVHCHTFYSLVLRCCTAANENSIW
jgi:hypothetical protein